MPDGDSYFEDTNSKRVMEVRIMETAIFWSTENLSCLQEKLLTLKGFCLCVALVCLRFRHSGSS